MKWAVACLRFGSHAQACFCPGICLWALCRDCPVSFRSGPAMRLPLSLGRSSAPPWALCAGLRALGAQDLLPDVAWPREEARRVPRMPPELRTRRGPAPRRIAPGPELGGRAEEAGGARAGPVHQCPPAIPCQSAAALWPLRAGKEARNGENAAPATIIEVRRRSGRSNSPQNGPCLCLRQCSGFARTPALYRRAGKGATLPLHWSLVFGRNAVRLCARHGGLGGRVNEAAGLLPGMTGSSLGASLQERILKW